MNTNAYNDYVLTASLETAWITAEQKQSVEAALQHLPGMAALDLLLEQNLLNEEQVGLLRNLILQAETPLPASDLPFTLADLLQEALQRGAADLLISPDAPVSIRLNGRLMPLKAEGPPLTPPQTEILCRQFLTLAQQQQLLELGYVESSYQQAALGRFRNITIRQRRGWESAFHIVGNRVRSMQELGLPPALHNLIRQPQGLILVTGSAGSGKTTTLAAMIDEINRQRPGHIITLEDPVEYLFSADRCRITQREIQVHTSSYAAALRTALRQDPDVIMVGELRDLATIALAISAAETGHLVLASLHTSSAAHTLQRLLDVFPAEQRAQIRSRVSESLLGVVSQQLVPHADGQGRVLAVEVMLNNPAIANLLREGKNFMLPNQIRLSQKDGMVLMDDALLNLARQKQITATEALNRSEDRKTMEQHLAENL